MAHSSLQLNHSACNLATSEGQRNRSGLETQAKGLNELEAPFSLFSLLLLNLRHFAGFIFLLDFTRTTYFPWKAPILYTLSLFWACRLQFLIENFERKTHYDLKLEDCLLHELNGTPFILLKRPRLYARLVPDFQIFFSICLFILSFLGLEAISFYLHASFHCFAPRIQSSLSGCPMNFFPSAFHLGFLLIFFRLLFEFHILRPPPFSIFGCWQVVLLTNVRRHHTNFLVWGCFFFYHLNNDTGHLCFFP